jgi:hypothetical protein
MRRRRVECVLAAVVVLAAFALLFPFSPFYLPKFSDSQGQLYQGRSPRHWLEALKDPDATIRRQAVYALGATGAEAAEAAEAIPALARVMLEDRDHATRVGAALALSKLCPATRSAVPALGKALVEQDSEVRMHAALTLSRLKKAARPAIPALIKALRDERNLAYLPAFTFSIQEIIAQALGRASAGSAEGVPALTAALADASTEELRLASTRALGDLGRLARPAVPQLRALLRDNSLEVRQAAAWALRKIVGKPATGKYLDEAREKTENLKLPEAERKYIWEIEHHGNVLVKYGFGRLVQALKNADGSALSRLLADDFAGTDLDRPRRVQAKAGRAEALRLQDAGHPGRPLGRQDFVARLLEFRKLFPARPPEVKLKLMTLSPRQRGQFDGAWEGMARLRLFGEQARGAPAEVVVMLRYVVSRPTTSVLARPGWLQAAGVAQVLTARAPRYLFAEVARRRGLDASKLHDNWKNEPLRPITGGVYVCDFDRDGILDLLVTDVNGNFLYRGRPDGTFEDVTRRCGLPRGHRLSTVAAWVDIDGDGWEDLILGGRVYRNEGGKRFVDYTSRCNLRLPRDASGVIVADYDRDGKLDLYVTRICRPGKKSWLAGKSGDSLGNRLFRNLGNWQFEDVTRSSGTLGGHRSTFTAAWLDANNDGWPDLHVINEFGDGVLLVNNRDGTFSGHALADRPADFGSMGLAVGDVNNDGHIDIFCANMYSKAGMRVIGNVPEGAYPPDVMEKMRRFVAGSQLHLNRGGLKFEQVGTQMQVAAVGWSYGACLADLDNDGWLDLYATAGFISRDRTKPDG